MYWQRFARAGSRAWEERKPGIYRLPDYLRKVPLLSIKPPKCQFVKGFGKNVWRFWEGLRLWQIWMKTSKHCERFKAFCLVSSCFAFKKHRWLTIADCAPDKNWPCKAKPLDSNALLTFCKYTCKLTYFFFFWPKGNLLFGSDSEFTTKAFLASLFYFFFFSPWQKLWIPLHLIQRKCARFHQCIAMCWQPFRWWMSLLHETYFRMMIWS